MDVDKRMAHAIQAVKERDHLLKRIENTANIIKEKEKHKNELEQQMLKEGKDIEKLDGMTLLNLWHSFKGTKDVVRQQEQEEYLRARLKFDETRGALEAMKTELRKMEKNLSGMGDPDVEYLQVSRIKEEFLMRSSGPESRRLFEIQEELGGLKAHQKELLEAVDAGKRTQEAIVLVKNNLNSARGWGAADVLGGGLIITAIKHSHIDQARKYINQVHHRLLLFRQELSDIDAEGSIEIGGLVTFGDFLCDGLLFDLIVQSQINTARERINELGKNIQNTITRLQKLLADNSSKAVELNRERKQIIENTNILSPEQN